MLTTRKHFRKFAGTVAMGAVCAVMSGTVVLARQANSYPAQASRSTQGVVINSVQFEGNKKVNKTVLSQYVRSKEWGRFDQSIVDSDAEVIREIYRRAGRELATVTPRVINLPNGKVDVVFTVKEGGKTGIKEIAFVGNNVFSAGRLRSQIATTEMNFLSFLKNTDVYDPDRLAADEDRIRRYYQKHGYADARVIGSESRFDEEKGGYVVTFTVEEGEQYRVGQVNIDSRLPSVEAEDLRKELEISSGEVYNGLEVEKTLYNMTNTVVRRGHGFAQVRPVANRNRETKIVDISYIIEDGPRVYIERINIRGNDRTRDYVIRREFDVSEGDAYNRVLIQRAERRLNNLGYFKTVKVTNEPGSAPDRVIVNVDVEDQSTGSFSISGGYSTSDGFIGEVSVTESNFMGRGQYVKVAGSYGENTKGIEFSFTEPYFMGYRLAVGFDVFTKFSDMTTYSRYENRMTGGQLRVALPLTENMTTTLRYSLYKQDMTIPNDADEPYNDCSSPIAGVTTLNPDGTANRYACEWNGEASLAIKQAAGERWTSLVGLTWNYNTLDNRKAPRSGLYVEVKPEIAGLGGDSEFFRISGEMRYYRELTENLVGMVRLQGGHISGFGNDDLNILDHYFMGPSLVRGFAPSGMGPRDISTNDSRSNAIGGTTYFGGTLELQFPIFGTPRELGLRGAVFADAGTVFGYKGGKTFDLNGDGVINGIIDGYGTCGVDYTKSQECIKVRDSKDIRSSVGASLMWDSPLGPIRFDYAHVLTQDDGILVNGVRVGKDRTQAFRFSSGGSF